MPLLTCPRQFTITQGASRLGDEAPTEGKRRPTHSALSVYFYTQEETPGRISVNNLIRAGDVPCAKLVVYVDSGYF